MAGQGTEFPAVKEELRSILDEECGHAAAAELCEDRVVAELLQTRILENDVEGIADFLTEATRVEGIASGLRIPKDYDFLPNTNSQNVHPDVAALKGLALAVIDGTDADTLEGTSDSVTHGMGLINKLVNAVVISSQSPSGVTFLCKFDLRPVYSFKAGVTISRSSVCTANATGGLVDAAQLRASLLDISLMAEIIDADVDLEDHHHQLMGIAGKHSMKCETCDNQYGYICSNCWKAHFCNQFDWCL